MNKQEAIKKLESIKAIGNDAIAACYNEYKFRYYVNEKNRRTAETSYSTTRGRLA